jgi:CBS domain protein
LRVDGEATVGSRLGVLLKTAAGWEIFYDHWAAQTIGLDIALDGAQATIERVRRMAPMGVDDPHAWKGATWIEGTLLIDEARKLVVWAEESEALYMPRLINYLVEHTWPGWTAVWSAEGTRGTLRAAGVDPTTIFTYRSDRTPYDRAPDLEPWGEWHGADPITVRMADGTLVTWRAYGFLDDVVGFGPENFLALAREVASRLPDESNAWEPTMDDDVPTTGIFVDYQARSLRWWSLQDEDMHLEDFTALWPGWTLTSSSDDYSWHQELTGQVFRTWADDVDECRSWIAKAIEEGARANPLVSLAIALSGQGHEVSPYASALEFVPSNRKATMDSFDRLLDAVRDEPLKPARMIDRHGTITPPLNEEERTC